MNRVPSHARPAVEAYARVARVRADERRRMVDEQIARRGVHAPRVLEAFYRVPRELFVPVELSAYAYDDSPLPIAEGQTISQPYIVARTLDALDVQPTDRALEVGTGSGYAAALLRELAATVDTVERLPGLAATARARFDELGLDVRVHLSDGTLGWPDGAPYDVIAVAAGGPRVPEALLDQLAPYGRLVIPVRTDGHQNLVRVVRTGPHVFREQVLEPVKFVPLIGAQGEREVTDAR